MKRALLTLGMLLGPGCGTGTSARDQDLDGGAVCTPPERTPAMEQVNASTLATVAAARPDKRVPVVLDLVDLPYDFSQPGMQAEREEQLRSIYEDTGRRLEALGATDIGHLWVVAQMSARMAVKDIPATLCWPYVRTVRISAHYWEVVDPPWDAGVAPGECPVQGGGCPEHCFEVLAHPVEELGDGGVCWAPQEVTLCTMSGVASPAFSCGRSPDGGIHWFPYWWPFSGEFAGWRPCTDQERDRTQQAPDCT